MKKAFWLCPSCTTLMNDMQFRNTMRVAKEDGYSQKRNLKTWLN